MAKFLLRSHLCLMILLLSGYCQASVHAMPPRDYCHSPQSLLTIELATGVEQDFFNSLPPEELRHVFKIHATEVREEEEEDHEEIACKKKLDGGKYVTALSSRDLNEYFFASREAALSLAAKLPYSITSKRYLKFCVFRI